MTDTTNSSFQISLPVTFRLAQKDDLPRLEWFGQYTHYRNVFQRNFRDQQAGRRFMLLADMNGFPIGQIFAQLVFPDEGIEPRGHYVQQATAYFYSLRVMDMFRGHGLGKRLLQEAEQLGKQAGCVRGSIAAARDNPRARRMYERAGYVVVGEDRGEWSYTDHLGRLRQVREPCFVLEKYL